MQSESESKIALCNIDTSIEYNADFAEEEIRCPICYTVPFDKIYNCVNGHMICGECLARIERNNRKCAQCSSDFAIFVPYRNRFMESIMQKIKRPCFNSSLGCTKRLNKAELINHTNECEYDSFECKFKIMGCEWEGFRHQYENHIEQCLHKIEDVDRVQKVIDKRVANLSAQVEHLKCVIESFNIKTKKVQLTKIAEDVFYADFKMNHLTWEFQMEKESKIDESESDDSKPSFSYAISLPGIFNARINMKLVLTFHFDDSNKMFTSNQISFCGERYQDALTGIGFPKEKCLLVVSMISFE